MQFQSFWESLSVAPDGADRSALVAALVALHQYRAIRVRGHDAADVPALLRIRAEAELLADSDPCRSSLIAFTNALPFWAESGPVILGRRVVYTALLQFGNALFARLAHGGRHSRLQWSDTRLRGTSSLGERAPLTETMLVQHAPCWARRPTAVVVGSAAFRSHDDTARSDRTRAGTRTSTNTPHAVMLPPHTLSLGSRRPGRNGATERPSEDGSTSSRASVSSGARLDAISGCSARPPARTWPRTGASLIPWIATLAAGCQPAPGVIRRFTIQRTYSSAEILATRPFTIISTHEPCRRRDAPPCSLLAHTRAVFAAPHHGVVLLDSHQGLLRLDSLGTDVQGIGGFGTEPGRYVNVSSLAFVNDTTVWIVDPGLSRGILYVTGRPQKTVSFRADKDATGRYLAGRYGLVGMSIPVADSAGEPVVAEWGAVADDGSTTPVRGVQAQSLRGKDDFFAPDPPFFSTRPLWTVTGNSVVYVLPRNDSSEAVVEAFTPAGAPLWRTGLPIPTRRPTPAEIAREDTTRLRRVFTTHADSLLSLCKDSLAIRHCVAVRVGSEYAKRADRPYPTPSLVVGTPSGDVWLRGAPLAGTDSVDWLRLHSGGHLLGRLRLASSDSLRSGDGSEVLIARLDSVAGQRAVWLRLAQQ